MSKQNQRKKKGLVNLIALLVLVVAIGVAGFLFVKDKAVAYAKDYTVQEVVKRYLPDGVSEEQVEKISTEIQNTMSEEDKKAVNDIIESKVNVSTVTEAAKYATSGDTSGLQQYVQGMLSEEEQLKLLEIYSSYGDDVLTILQENGIDINDYQ